MFELLVVAFTSDTTPPLVFKSPDDLFAGHKLIIHTNTHRVKEEVKGQLSISHYLYNHEHEKANFNQVLDRPQKSADMARSRLA
ncbi:MAG: hypothetical protein PVSMB11_10040 [Desulfuromonadaceae bacterium]